MIDVTIVFLFVAYAIWAGFSSRKDASLGPEEYFLAGRRMPGWKAGLSMAATQYAADTPLVVTGLVATAGIFAMWRFWVYSIAFLMMGFLLAPAWRRAQILTDAELCEVRYSGRAAEVLRYFKAVYFGTVINCVVMAMVLLAATRITEPFLPWHEWLPGAVLSPLTWLVEAIGNPLTADTASPDVWLRSASNLFSILVIVGFTALYSTTGGLRSVINTDVVQVILALIATGSYAWIVATEAGGLGAIPERLAAIYGDERVASMLSFSPVEGATTAIAVIGLLGVQWFAQTNSDGTGYLAQRSMACHSDDGARKAAVIFTYVQSVLRTLLWLPIVVGLLLLYPDPTPAAETDAASREFIFVLGIKDYLPTGFLGLMLVGLFAALASTIDTHLNWGASYWTNDIYDRLWCKRIRKRRPDPRHLVMVARLSNILILVIALAIMSQLSSIGTAWKMSLLFGAGMGVPLLLRWLWYRQNAWGELLPMLLSFILAPILLKTMPGDDVSNDSLRLLIMTGASTGACLIAAFLFPRVSEEVIVPFYRRVRPPGWWGPVALAAGMSPSASRQAFRTGALATGLASASVFALIVGLGSWMVSAPGPGFLPQWLWVGGLVVVGLGLIPAWYKVAWAAEKPELPNARVR